MCCFNNTHEEKSYVDYSSAMMCIFTGIVLVENTGLILFILHLNRFK
jgi:hypothetical protein